MTEHHKEHILVSLDFPRALNDAEKTAIAKKIQDALVHGVIDQVAGAEFEGVTVSHVSITEEDPGARNSVYPIVAATLAVLVILGWFMVH